jgi:hypothetical protein
LNLRHFRSQGLDAYPLSLIMPQGKSVSGQKNCQNRESQAVWQLQENRVGKPVRKEVSMWR